MACMGYDYLNTPKRPGTLTFTAEGVAAAAKKKRGGESKHMALSRKVLIISIIRIPGKKELSYSRC